MDTEFSQTSHWAVIRIPFLVSCSIILFAEISRHDALMKQQFSVICSFFFLVLYFYWNRLGNTCFLYVIILYDMLSVCILTTDPPTLYRRVCLHFLVLWDRVQGVRFSLFGHINTVLRSWVDVWPISINKNFWLVVLSCEHLQYGLPAHLEGYLKVICFLSWFCVEQSHARLVNFIITCQENSPWNEEMGKDCCLFLFCLWKESLRFCKCTPQCWVNGRVNRRNDYLLIQSILG